MVTLIESNVLEHKLGDIILTSNNTIMGKINKSYQKSRICGDANFTHVMLCVGPKIFLEATKLKKVEFITAKHSNRSSLNSKEFMVIRNIEFSNKLNDIENIALREKFTAKIHYHIDKSYNYYGLIKKNYSNELKTQKNAFCSELIASIYREFEEFKEIDIFKSLPQNVMPSSFEKLIDIDGWMDVTDLYLSEIHIKNTDDLYRYSNNNYYYVKYIENQFSSLEKLTVIDRNLSINIDNLMLNNIKMMKALLVKDRIGDNDLNILILVFEYLNYLKTNKIVSTECISWKSSIALNKTTSKKNSGASLIQQLIIELNNKYSTLKNKKFEELLENNIGLNNTLITRLIDETKNLTAESKEEHILLDCSLALLELYSGSINVYVLDYKKSRVD